MAARYGLSLRPTTRQVWLLVALTLVWHVVVIAVQQRSCGRSAILAYTMPTFAAIWGRWLWGDRLGLRTFVGVAAAAPRGTNEIAKPRMQRVATSVDRVRQGLCWSKRWLQLFAWHGPQSRMRFRCRVPSCLRPDSTAAGYR